MLEQIGHNLKLKQIKIKNNGFNSQIDLKDKKQSGFDWMSKKLSFIEGVETISLKTNHRDPIVEEILKTLSDS